MTLGQLAKTFVEKLAEKKFFAFKNLQRMHIEPVRVSMNIAKRDLMYANFDEDQMKEMLMRKMLEELKKHMVMKVTDRQDMPMTSYEAEIFIGMK